jgi:hypothetical protein
MWCVQLHLHTYEWQVNSRSSISNDPYRESGKSIFSNALFSIEFRSSFIIRLLKNNYFGLWAKPFVHIDIDTTEALVTSIFIFRPLCISQYLAIGVFQGPDMDKQDCFLCQYGFELHNLLIEEDDDRKQNSFTCVMLLKRKD